MWSPADRAPVPIAVSEVCELASTRTVRVVFTADGPPSHPVSRPSACDGLQFNSWTDRRVRVNDPAVDRQASPVRLPAPGVIGRAWENRGTAPRWPGRTRGAAMRHARDGGLRPAARCESYRRRLPEAGG